MQQAEQTAVQDRPWVSWYVRMLYTLGLGVILLAAIGWTMAWVNSPQESRYFYWWRMMATVGAIRMVVLGFITLSVAQLLRFSFSSRPTPGRLVTLGSLLLYLQAATQVITYLTQTLFRWHFDLGPMITKWDFLQQAWPAVASALLLVALGLLLRRVIPVIEESRTLA